MLGDSVRSRLRASGPRRPRTRQSSGASWGLKWRVLVPALIAALVICFAAGYALAVVVLFPAPEVEGVGIATPNLIGMQLRRAEQAVRAAGLGGVEVNELPHPTHARGVVTAQTPLPGQQLRTGASVRVAVSSGPPRVVVPDVVGFSAERGRELLERLGFHVAETEEEGGEVAGRVVRVAPAPGTEHELPARITLVVSTGPVAIDTVRTDTLLRVDTLPRSDTIRARRRGGATDTTVHAEIFTPRRNSVRVAGDTESAVR